MRYTKQIVILMLVNLIIGFLLIFVGHNSRQIEISNINLESYIISASIFNKFSGSSLYGTSCTQYIL